MSPGILLHSVEEGEVAEVGDRLGEITNRQEGIALVDLLAGSPARVKVGLVHMPENRTRDLGDHDGVVLTYETLRVAPYDPDTCDVAVFRDGFWTTPDGETWTDVDLSVAGGAS